MFQSEEDLKVEWLRWKVDEDGTLIVEASQTSRLGKRRQKDHLYFYGPGILGLYFERDSCIGFGQATREYRRELRGLIVEELLGDFDGIILFKPEKASQIPQDFKPDGFRGPRSLAPFGFLRPDGSLTLSRYSEG